MRQTHADQWLKIVFLFSPQVSEAIKGLVPATPQRLLLKAKRTGVE